jgi:hypothetical protein
MKLAYEFTHSVRIIPNGFFNLKAKYLKNVRMNQGISGNGLVTLPIYCSKCKGGEDE